jgi:hypothetical protein
VGGVDGFVDWVKCGVFVSPQPERMRDDYSRITVTIMDNRRQERIKYIYAISLVSELSSGWARIV